MEQLKSKQVTFSRVPKVAKVRLGDLRNSRLEVIRKMAGKSNPDNNSWKYITESQKNLLDRYGVHYQLLSKSEKDEVNQPREKYQKPSRIEYDYSDAWWNN